LVLNRIRCPDSREEHNIHTRTASVCKCCRVGLERVSSRVYFIVHHSIHSTPTGVRGRSYFRILGIRLNRIEVKNVRELYNIIIFNVTSVRFETNLTFETSIYHPSSPRPSNTLLNAYMYHALFYYVICNDDFLSYGTVMSIMYLH